ncbi:MAG: protein TolR [Pseudomonadota bacterium]|jgi:biopolymer transport protein TolR|nr:protein TolR [Alphaproteobacteria bacterium]MEC7576474.1 protein TolR [Pseudomonadota bacterium]MEC9235278.1 protein TolR [Pseudomonadota bacterium]|tara:strand:- start:363 stop:809 length:447 start_codon:yes stop_codon:yes gene_type:complete
MGMSTGNMSWKRSPGSGRRGYRPMAEINVTPFVDVMLVLLIVFMVSAPLLTAGVAVDLPRSEASALKNEDESPIEITMQQDGKLYVGEQEIKRDALVPFLRSVTMRNLDRRIYIRADQGLEYGKVMEVLGGINREGFNKVALISTKSK